MPARRKSRHGKAARCGWQARSVPAFHSDGSSRSGSQETSRPSWWARSQCLVILPVSALQWAVRADSCASYRTDRRVLFGSRWAEAVPLARLLAIASLASFAGCLTYPMLVAVGRVRDALIAPSLLRCCSSLRCRSTASKGSQRVLSFRSHSRRRSHGGSSAVYRHPPR